MIDPANKKHVLLLLGSNLGNRMKLLDQALEGLTSMGEILLISSVYESEAWGFVTDAKFLNLAVELSTMLSPMDVLRGIHEIEGRYGRKRISGLYQSREIDIDIIFYDAEIIYTDQLNIPHPLMPERRFALVPLAEIAGEWIHPVIKKTISGILAECRDGSVITRISNGRNFY